MDHCFKISLLLIGNLKYDRFVSLFDWLAQPGTQKNAPLSQLLEITHMPLQSYNNANVSNEYALLCDNLSCGSGVTIIFITDIEFEHLWMQALYSLLLVSLLFIVITTPFYERG